MHEVLVNRLGGLSLPRKSVVRLTDHPDMTLDVYSGRKTIQQQQQVIKFEKEKLKFLNDLPQARMLSVTNPLPIFFFFHKDYALCSGRIMMFGFSMQECVRRCS